jgi:hypothetical protein
MKLNIKLEKGGLSGYSLKDSLVERRKVLKKLVKVYDYSGVIKRLNVLYIFNRNNHQTTANKFHRDMVYIKKLKVSKSKSVKSVRKSKKRKSVKRKSVKRKSIKRKSRKTG